MVSRPGKPGGGFSEDFSCTVCGALEHIAHLIAHFDKKRKINEKYGYTN
jgi:hypothetical protein